MTTQFAVSHEYGRNSLKKLTVHDTEIPNLEARLALTFLEKWGMVAAKADGEDSAGRSIIKEYSPDEIVDRACSVAEKACAVLRARGWMVAGPDVSELMRDTDD